MEPLVGEDSGDDACGARNGSGEAARTEGGTIDEEVEFVGGFAARTTAVEGDGEDTVLDLG